MPTDTDDIAVIQMVLQGRQDAYATLVSRYQTYVFTLAMRYVNNRELAEELAQDIFVKAYRCLADFKQESKFSTWLYTIVYTTCLSYLRKKKNETVPLDEVMEQNYTPETPASKLEQKMQQSLIDNAIRALPEQDAALISLYYQAGQSIEETGVILGLSAGNVKVKLFRARQKLKEILAHDYKNELT